jgi:uncharacterized protein DUF4396
MTALDRLATTATGHCLTGCALGEIAGLALGTALGWGNLATILAAVALAFLFGYGLTSLPLLSSGMALAAVLPVALAADTFSITVMEIVDNAIVLVVPGAMDAGLGDLLFWGSLALALATAFAAAWPVNRALIARGKGHAVVHEHHGHADHAGHDGDAAGDGDHEMGPWTFGRVVAVVAGMFVFGAAVVVLNAG